MPSQPSSDQPGAGGGCAQVGAAVHGRGARRRAVRACAPLMAALAARPAAGACWPEPARLLLLQWTLLLRPLSQKHSTHCMHSRRLYLAQAEIEADRNRWVRRRWARCSAAGSLPACTLLWPAPLLLASATATCCALRSRPLTAARGWGPGAQGGRRGLRGAARHARRDPGEWREPLASGLLLTRGAPLLPPRGSRGGRQGGAAASPHKPAAVSPHTPAALPLLSTTLNTDGGGGGAAGRVRGSAGGAGAGRPRRGRVQGRASGEQSRGHGSSHCVRGLGAAWGLPADACHTTITLTRCQPQSMEVARKSFTAAGDEDRRWQGLVLASSIAGLVQHASSEFVSAGESVCSGERARRLALRAGCCCCGGVRGGERKGRHACK